MDEIRKKMSRTPHPAPGLSRRDLLGLGLVAATAAATVAACGNTVERRTVLADPVFPPGEGGAPPEAKPAAEPSSDPWRLTARPGGSGQEPLPKLGFTRLGLGQERDGYLFLPPQYSADRPAPLLVLLHGAYQAARLVVGSPLEAPAAEQGLILLVPDSRGGTWDLIANRRVGPDAAFLDRALAHVFARCAVDPKRLGLGGFSDGASYALSLGLANGDFFTHLVAFSPGFISPLPPQGKPRIYVSHGTEDEILPIETCSRRIIPALEADGYDVLYREFRGPHGITPEVGREALEWFAGKTPAA